MPRGDASSLDFARLGMESGGVGPGRAGPDSGARDDFYTFFTDELGKIKSANVIVREIRLSRKQRFLNAGKSFLQSLEEDLKTLSRYLNKVYGVIFDNANILAHFLF